MESAFNVFDDRCMSCKNDEVVKKTIESQVIQTQSQT